MPIERKLELPVVDENSKDLSKVMSDLSPAIEDFREPPMPHLLKENMRYGM